MARRKAHKKRTTRRRRIGAAGKLNARNPLVKVGSMAIGYLMADTINSQIEKITGDKMDDKLLAGLEAGAGILLAFGPVPKRKTLPVVLIGGVLAGAGLKKGLEAFGVINGFHNVPVLAGWRDVPALAGPGYNPTPGAGLGSYNPTPGKVMGSVFNPVNDDGASGYIDRRD